MPLSRMELDAAHRAALDCLAGTSNLVILARQSEEMQFVPSFEGQDETVLDRYGLGQKLRHLRDCLSGFDAMEKARPLISRDSLHDKMHSVAMKMWLRLVALVIPFGGIHYGRPGWPIGRWTVEMWPPVRDELLRFGQLPELADPESTYPALEGEY